MLRYLRIPARHPRERDRASPSRTRRERITAAKILMLEARPAFILRSAARESCMLSRLHSAGSGGASKRAELFRVVIVQAEVVAARLLLTVLDRFHLVDAGTVVC